MQYEEMRLDGNAAAGDLAELFVPDMTTAAATCAGCGATRPLGALVSYGQPMGVVLRCPGCETAVLRMVRARSGWRVDFTGLALLAFENQRERDKPRS
jgi:hypothetical protein